MTTEPAPLETDVRPPAPTIGYPIWWMNVNLRVYAPIKPGQGYAHGPPIWKKHWQLVRITGETARMWVVHHGAAKFSKAIQPGMVIGPGLAWTEAEIDRMAWAHENRYHVAQMVQALPLETLERVARLLGYEPLP